MRRESAPGGFESSPTEPNEADFERGREFLDNLQNSLDQLASKKAGFPHLHHGDITFTASSAFGDKNARLFIKAYSCSHSRSAITRYGDEQDNIHGYPDFKHLDPVQVDYLVVKAPNHPGDHNINVYAYGLPIESDSRDYIIERDIYRIVGLRNLNLAVVSRQNS